MNVTSTVVTETLSGTSFSLQLSGNPFRNLPVPLANEQLSGNIYIFTDPDLGVDKVQFWLDDPTMSGASLRTENYPPFDFAGGSVASAKPYNTNLLTNGVHTITALLLFEGGESTVITESFSVNN